MEERFAFRDVGIVIASLFRRECPDYYGSLVRCFLCSEWVPYDDAYAITDEYTNYKREFYSAECVGK